MKILATSDPHQMISKWKDFVKVCQHEQPDVALVSGDLLPKDCDITGQEFFIKHLRKYATKIQDFTDAEFVLMLGNDDNQLLIPDMEQGEKDGLWRFVHEKVVTIGGYEFVGMPWVPDYPFGYKFWCRKEHIDVTEYCYQQRGRGVEINADNHYETIENLYDYFEAKPSIEESFNVLVPQVEDMAKSIWLIHAPPSGYNLDVCSTQERVGSKAVTEFIQHYQPLLTIHGHIHESPEYSGKWMATIGDTTAIQNGQIGMKLHYNVISIEDGKIVGDIKRRPKGLVSTRVQRSDEIQ